MTSKLGIKPSRRERPKSSEKVAPARFARRPKETGTPENKVQSPVATICHIGDASDSASPIQTISEWEKEIKSLRINTENLKSTATQPVSKSDNQSTKVLVRKKVSSFEIPREKKKITVAQRAPSDAKVKLPNPEDFPGLRVDDSGRIVPHSILGSTEDFIEYAVKNGHEHNVPAKIGPKSTPSPWPEDDDSEKHTKTLQETRQIRVDETRALENWERQINIRMNEQRYLSDAMGMPPDMLLMNQDEDFRRKQEDRTLIDRAMPAVDYGKGYRVGSEFWKQVEVIDGEEGIKMTLTQTERGYAPPFEYIGKPDTIRKLMGTNWKETRRMANIHYPWLKSQYLQERKQKLMNVIEGISSHRPYLDELEIVGQSLSNDKEEDNIFVDKVDIASELSEATQLDDGLSDPLADYEDVIPLPIFGPSLTINGYAAQWKDSGKDDKSSGLNIRLNFQVDVGSKSYNTINITNDGTAAVYFSWKKIPIKDPFGIKKIRPLQRFFFDLRNGVILPNSSINMPLTFVSPNAGIFAETWQLDTQPELCGGSPIYIILRGIATEADKFADKRKELEEELQRRQVDTFIKDIVEEIFNGVRTPPRPSTPVDSYLTEEELFSRQNRKMNFNTEAVNDLKVFHTQLRPDGEWNMSIDTLLKEAQGTEDDDLKETFVQKLNEDVQMFANSLDSPVQKTSYNLCYQLLCEAMDNFYAKAGKLRLSVGLPEKEFAVEVQQEEVSRKPKKSQAPEAQKLTSDKKQDPKKKDLRPTSSRGKISGNSKAKVKETASTLPMPKLVNVDVSSSKSSTIVKSKVEKKEPKSPLEIWFSKDLCLQLYDILCDVANRMETSF